MVRAHKTLTKPKTVKEEISFLLNTIDFHERKLNELKDDLDVLRQKCMHEYDASKQCIICKMYSYESYRRVPTSPEELIKQAKRLKAIYIKNVDAKGMSELRSLWEDKCLANPSWPTFEQL